MRPAIRPSSPLEAIGLALGRVPTPVAEAMFGMILARSVMAGVRLGIFRRLSEAGAASAGQLAAALELDQDGTRHLLDALVATGYLKLTRDHDAYRLTRRARRWLDPRSDRAVNAFVESNYDQWEWWSRLEDVVRSGEPLEMHERPADDPYWERYIRGQYEIARLSAPEVVRGLRLPGSARSLLDLAGGHGWFAAALCARHDGLTATVIDLPASAAVGREIIRETGMADRVRHVDGDLRDADLGGPHDAVLLFNIVHHLSPEQNIALLRRLRAVLRRDGGIVAVFDLFRPAYERSADASAYLGLHFWLMSGASTYSPEDLAGWLGEAGFSEPRRVPLRANPAQTLYEARAP